MKTINIPTMGSNDTDFTNFFNIANDVMQDPINYYCFNFSNCLNLSHLGMLLIGGLARYIGEMKVTPIQLAAKNIKNIGVTFDTNSMSPSLMNSLIKNNFLKHFKETTINRFQKSPVTNYLKDKNTLNESILIEYIKKTLPSKIPKYVINNIIKKIINNLSNEIDNSYPYEQGDYIGYLEHKNTLDETTLTEYLESGWLSKNRLKLSPQLKSEIISRIVEIFMNSYGHGVSNQVHHNLGVYSCGEYDSKLKQLHLSVLDFGIGIAKNVMTTHLDITDQVDALNWALQQGNSTNTDSINTDIPRGLGFELLRKFVMANEGKLRIYSNSVQACTTSNGVFETQESKFSFPGTLVSITINCDDKYYILTNETTHTAYF
ncbi:hypothetical protein [Acinetobacter rudis]|uniref:hypothetical protein n=1 Tax=Acinetobacter rudis TaxID=632955 RepID=UPI00333F216E